MALEKYYSSKGYGHPNYIFSNYADGKGTQMFCCEVILPNGFTIRGAPKFSSVEVCIFYMLF